jgi:hypothetical protein
MAAYFRPAYTTRSEAHLLGPQALGNAKVDSGSGVPGLCLDGGKPLNRVHQRQTSLRECRVQRIILEREVSLIPVNRRKLGSVTLCFDELRLMAGV